MPLVTISNLSIQFQGPPLLDGVDCLIDAGERIGLLGRNGAGKTTFLRMLAGRVQPDSGRIDFASGAKVALLQQDVPQDITGSVHDVVLAGVPQIGSGDESEAEHWRREHAVDQILSRMQLDPADRFESFSAGMKRRVLLARAIVDQPDLLLLDEPTNHLDIPAIEWLETFLSRWNKALVFITHDRQFLRRIAQRILEIENGKLFDWTCDYDKFLVRKEAALAAEEKQNALFDKKLAQEEVWIRQGVKARRTRNEGRVRALKEMRNQRKARPAAIGTATIQIQEALRSGNLVLSADKISFGYGERKILDNFSTTIMRGDKIGIVGRNGAGKTTLLRILLGKLAPDSGNIKFGTNVQTLYFDQLRDQLDDEATVQQAVGDGYETVKINGSSQHIIGYLQNFLFTPARARTQIKMLSGGERNRVLLAKLFTKPANLIVLDEPTNDLDAETLELLEERLVQFDGTLMIVSHDREFLNNVVSSLIVFEDDVAREYVGGYDDWLQRAASKPSAEQLEKKGAKSSKPAEGSSEEPSAKVIAKPAKLSFKQQKELDQVTDKIAKIESTIADRHREMSDPDFYKKPSAVIVEVQTALQKMESELEALYTRWEELNP
jgi:ATP-binding cassette subfamily F protein uup